VLVAPLVVFTGFDRGWWGDDGPGRQTEDHSSHTGE